jgi:hypothetical protein
MAPISVYVVRYAGITTGSRIESFSDGIVVYKNKRKAIINAYNNALEFALEYGLPVTGNNRTDTLTITDADIEGIKEEYINLDGEDDDDEEDNKDNEDEDNESVEIIKNGILKVGNFYEWPERGGGGYDWPGCYIHVYQDVMDTEATDGIIFKARFGF